MEKTPNVRPWFATDVAQLKQYNKFQFQFLPQKLGK